MDGAFFVHGFFLTEETQPENNGIFASPDGTKRKEKLVERSIFDVKRTRNSMFFAKRKNGRILKPSNPGCLV